jgi:hypothetical protein
MSVSNLSASTVSFVVSGAHLMSGLLGERVSERA